jgi:hypothetical protein
MLFVSQISKQTKNRWEKYSNVWLVRGTKKFRPSRKGGFFSVQYTDIIARFVHVSVDQ